MWAEAQETSEVYAEDNDDYDDEIEVHPGGGKGSKVEERFDLIPPKALTAVAKAMSSGAKKYGEWNWELLDPEVSINHAMRHLVMWLKGDDSEDHLAHAAARCLMAFEVDNKEKP